MSAMYSWAIGEGLCETNPVDGTNKANEGKPRDRVLSDKELAASAMQPQRVHRKHRETVDAHRTAQG